MCPFGELRMRVERIFRELTGGRFFGVSLEERATRRTLGLRGKTNRM